ncbi:hypothetical protein [Cohnella zeiphila]|uniref:Uncharacterized protein n=1 Tax=Cohnella zeiphila TaxID=2761120 RepID=A0A7X0SPS1_9BACL|nr:hypothetical protein [Cohnella zeiphila]MBB6732779.1 hypothetical protein [Cohnella zeiphila]
MDRLVAWIQHELHLHAVVYQEKHSHGHLLRGNSEGKTLELLVVSSGHVWVKKPAERSWNTTGIYVPDRVLS